jgi:hypothetical protein
MKRKYWAVCDADGRMIHVRTAKLSREMQMPPMDVPECIPVLCPSRTMAMDYVEYRKSRGCDGAYRPQMVRVPKGCQVFVEYGGHDSAGLTLSINWLDNKTGKWMASTSPALPLLKRIEEFYDRAAAEILEKHPQMVQDVIDGKHSSDDIIKRGATYFHGKHAAIIQGVREGKDPEAILRDLGIEEERDNA